MRILSLVLAFVSVPLTVRAQSVGGATSLPAPGGAASPARLGWPGFGRTPQHDARASTRSQPLDRIRWQTPVDLQPQYSGSSLLVHYGSPLVTQRGTIVLPVKTGTTDGFRFEGRHPSSGALLWSQTTSYVLPPYNWMPSVGATLTPSNQLAFPESGGRITLRADPDAASSTSSTLVFYGQANYLANPAAYDASIVIHTPITSDAQGNLYFGFLALGATPLGLTNGIARISAGGTGSWTPVTTAAADGSMVKVTYNCAPAVSRDGASVYLTVNNILAPSFGSGYLLRLDGQTLSLQSKVHLQDAQFPANEAVLPDDGTSSPCIGPDGDVYIGVLENPFFSNHIRGWMLHFDATLATTKLPGAFGWDNTPSIVPVSAVPSYGGGSPYLLLTKYNHYAGTGGDGVNKVAVLDPFTPMADPVTGIPVMDEVLLKAGPTPDLGLIGTYPNAVREWCINTAAVDPLGKCALVNNEDGKLYRWDFVTDTLSEVMTLTAGIGEAYTPTVLGLDGTVYAINDATLFAVGR